MVRGTGKRPPIRPPDEATEAPDVAEAPEEIRAARVRPVVAQDERTRYESPPDSDVFAISQRDYQQLAGFLEGLSDRDRYSLALWRCDPRIPTNRKKQKYLPGGLDVPDGMLEDALSELHGPGVYRWQLLKDGRYAGPDGLPPSLKSVAMSGYIQIAGEPLAEGDGGGGGGGGMVMLPPAPDERTELVRELLQQKREDDRSSRGEMVEIMRANNEGFKVQMGGMVETMRAQTTFLQAQLEMQRTEARERTAEKDGMWKEIVTLVKDLRGDGDGRSTADRLIDNIPGLISQLNGAGLFQARVPGRHAPAAAPGAPPIPPPGAPPGAPPTAAEAAQAAARPMAGPTEEERKDPMFQYIAQLVNKLHKCYSAELSPALTAEALEEIGSEDNFNWLLDQEPATVTGTVDSLHKRFVGGPAPEKFLAFTAATFQALQDKYPADEPAPGAPPDTAPAAPAPAPAAQPDSGANGQGVQP